MSEQIPHTEAVLALFEQTNRPVGDAKAPADIDEIVAEDYPYSVVYEYDVPFWRMQGPFSDTQADKQFIFNVVYVGLSAQQTRLLAKRGRDLIQKENITVPGHSTRDFRFEDLGRMMRDDDLRPPLFSISDNYLLDVTPTTG